MPTFDEIHHTARNDVLADQFNAGEWRHIGRTISSWLARSRQRKALAELDDRLLRDIGITRTEAKRKRPDHFGTGGKPEGAHQAAIFSRGGSP